MVDSIIQKAAIKVNRAGTKAAAVSAAFVVAGCAPIFEETKDIYFERPFVYAIINTENGGLPIFTGVVNKL